MKRIALLLIIATPFLMGQSCATPPEQLGNDTYRLSYNAYLADACPLGRAEVEMELSRIEVDRKGGVSYETQVTWNTDGCADSLPCLTCWTAMVDQVYGK